MFLTERATLHVFGRALIRSNTAVGNGGAVATAGGVVNFAGAHIFQVLSATSKYVSGTRHPLRE